LANLCFASSRHLEKVLDVLDGLLLRVSLDDSEAASTSFVSANGPSVTVNFPSESRTRTPAALGRHPSVAISQPASMASPINFPISAISCWVGGRSGLPGLYKHKNRIVVFLSLKRSTDTSNKGGQDRQVQRLFLLKIADDRPGNVSHGRGGRYSSRV
jgi:hypothetical protein